MLDQMKVIFFEVVNYCHRAWSSTEPILAFVGSILMWALFPDKALIGVAITLMLLIVLDFLTKIYAISKINGGYLSAVTRKKITSRSFWEGTKPKLIAFGVLIILCGLSMRMNELISPVGKWFTILAYTVMFFREIKSINENMADAGHKEFGTILLNLKKKQRQVLEDIVKTEKDKEKHPQD